MTSCAIVPYGTVRSEKDCKPLYFISDALYPGSSILNLPQHPCKVSEASCMLDCQGSEISHFREIWDEKSLMPV